MEQKNLLESYFVKDVSSYKKFNALTESEKIKLGKDTVNSLFRTIKNKSLHINYMGREKTYGDITKFLKYNDLAEVIKVLDTMYKNDPQVAPKEINHLVRAFDNLKKYKNEFSKAFTENNELVMVLYTNIAASIISGSAVLIAATIDYVKDPMGNYKEIFIKTKELENDVYFKSLERFNRMVVKGDLNRLFKNSSDVLNEDVGLVIGASMAIITCIILAVFIIRDIVFVYYKMKIHLGEQMLLLATFLEKHAYSLDTSVKGNKEVQKKQLQKVEKLKKMSDKLLVDRKNAEKQSEREKAEEDNRNSDYSSSGSTGDIFI